MEKVRAEGGAMKTAKIWSKYGEHTASVAGPGDEGSELARTEDDEHGIAYDGAIGSINYIEEALLKEDITHVIHKVDENKALPAQPISEFFREWREWAEAQYLE